MSSPSYASRFKLLKLSFPYPDVLHVELNRSPVNAFSDEFWHEYGAAFDHISTDPGVRVVVLSSSLKKAFSAGVDLAFLQGLPDAPDPGRRGLLVRKQVGEFQHAISAAARCAVPVIAAVHGVAFGLAVDIISACDIRYAASDALFSIKEVEVGLAADIGTLARLPKMTGNSSLLHEVALTARNFNSEEALRLGLVSKVVPGSQAEVVAAALDLARVIAAKSPIAVVGTKRFIAHARDHSIEDALEYQTTWNGVMLQAPDLVNAAAAAVRKTKMVYPPLGESPAKTKL
ncbi:ClpP/crotonase [Artomyces pyxidatus]|uniref:ClpP/crotonase n=1 Tax=Artomyces pyxidatus TaxID=48021 RepID=A0ACB8STS5_9AGAM|nr:ClpP/crotonase [Artomyces pyxidatus]